MAGFTMGEKIQLITLLLNLVSWLVGALILVIGIRYQVSGLTKSIDNLRLEFAAQRGLLTDHERRIGYTEGYIDGLKLAEAKKV